MRRVILALVIIASLFWGCEKEEDPANIIVETNSLAEDLKQIIANENVETVLPCPLGGICSGGSDEFSFPGDNFICVVGERCFNLNHLIRTEIETVGTGQNERIQMTLYFDPF